MKKVIISILCVVLVLAMLPMSVLARTMIVVKFASADANVGESFSQTFTYADYGFDVSGRSISQSSSTLSEYGLSGGYSGTALTVSGTPTKAGTATIVLLASKTGSSDHTFNITINIKESTTTKTATMDATVGTEVSQKFTYSDYGFTGGGYSISSDESTLSSYGLSGAYSGTALTISGTPTKAGTAVIRLAFSKSGVKNYLEVTVNIKEAASTTKKVSVDATVGTAVSQTFTYSDYGLTSSGYTISLDGSTLSEYGLSGSYSGTGVSITGTPTKAGTAVIRLAFSKSGVKNYLEVTVNIKDITSVSKTVTISVTLGTAISRTFNYADYGLTGSGYTISLDGSTLSEYGLSGSYSGTGVSITGTPTKTGMAEIRVVMKKTGEENYFKVKINIKEAESVTEKVSIDATVGTEVSQKFTYSDYGFTGGGYSISSDESTLSSYGLSGAYSGTALTISGTPTKAGTAVIRLMFTKSGVKSYLEVTVNIKEAGSVTKELTADATVGKSFSQAFKYAECGIDSSGSSISFDESTLREYGLSGSFSTTQLLVTGTPTTAGTAMVRLAFTKGGVIKYYLEVEINIVAATSGGDVKPGEDIDPDPDPVVDDKYVFPFVDVFESDWYYGDVYNANKMGLINGRTKTLYKPTENMTYAEAIKIAACMHQLNKDGKVTLANGTPNWYDSYVEYARVNGIPWDYKDYNAKVTREDFVHIFYYALPSDNYVEKNEIAKIPDVASTSAYYKEIITFYKAGILTGSDSKGNFYASSNIKRSEVAAILSRMMDATQRKTFSIK